MAASGSPWAASHRAAAILSSALALRTPAAQLPQQHVGEQLVQSIVAGRPRDRSDEEVAARHQPLESRCAVLPPGGGVAQRAGEVLGERRSLRGRCVPRDRDGTAPPVRGSRRTRRSDATSSSTSTDGSERSRRARTARWTPAGHPSVERTTWSTCVDLSSGSSVWTTACASCGRKARSDPSKRTRSPSSSRRASRVRSEWGMLRPDSTTVDPSGTTSRIGRHCSTGSRLVITCTSSSTSRNGVVERSTAAVRSGRTRPHRSGSGQSSTGRTASRSCPASDSASTRWRTITIGSTSLVSNVSQPTARTSASTSWLSSVDLP